MNFEFFTTDDGVKVGYMDQGSGIPVILLAGYSAPATSWYREEKTLSKHGYRAIAFDRRSHGSSANHEDVSGRSIPGSFLHVVLYFTVRDRTSFWRDQYRSDAQNDQ